MRRELNFFSREQSWISVRQFEAYKILNQARSLDTATNGLHQCSSSREVSSLPKGFQGLCSPVSRDMAHTGAAREGS